MPQQQQNVSIVAPGFAGLNTQDSPLGMDVSFASVAQNCVIDNFGRIASRRGFRYLTTNPSVLSGNPVVSLSEFVTAEDQRWLFASGNNKLYIQQTESPFELVELTLPGGYNITADNWKIVGFNEKCYFVQSNHQPLVFDPSVSTTALALWAEYPAETTGSNWPNEAAAAFGRLWLADFDNTNTLVAFSGLLDGENWSSDGFGTIVTEEYWPSGYDRVVAVAAHNSLLVLFGEQNILLYSTTADVANTLTLVDTIERLGCLSRDSIRPTGRDFMFVDASGVRSLNRTIQERSVPIGDVSRNVRDEFQLALRNESDQRSIKAVYLNEDSFYAVFLPENPLTYVFDTWNPLPDGSARATTWTNVTLRCAERALDRTTFFGGTGGVFTYTGAADVTLADDDTTVTTSEIPMEYRTHPIDFGEPANLVFPRQVDVVVIGGLTGTLGLEWGYDYQFNQGRLTQELAGLSTFTTWSGALGTGTGGEWGDDGTLGFYTTGQAIRDLKFNIWGSGRNITIGFDAQVLGTPISIQQVDIQALRGRLI